MNTIRVNLTLPKDRVDEARKKGNISKFTAESMAEVLRKERVAKAIASFRKLGPAFPEIKDAAKYVHNMRREDDDKRMKKLGLA